jgi:DNA polymerase I-like protein with 3'-5' exonuclease and polymerase domains/uracil-DNA glycosylase
MIGNTTDPKAVIILNCKEPEDLAGDILGGPKGITLLDAIDLDQFAVAYLVNDCLYADEVTQEGTRKPTELEVEKHLPDLLLEISKIDCGHIIPLGGMLSKAFTGEAVSKAAGKKFRRKYNGKDYVVVPNFDPGMVYKKERIKPDFESIFKRACLVDENGPKWAVLDYKETIKELKRVLKLYATGEIEYVIFDTETTSLDPHTGEVIMYSWAHTADERGFAVPLRTNNTIPDKEVFADYKLVDVYDPDNPYNIHTVDINLTEYEVAKINYLAKKVLETVPVVGHNLKFDVKYIHYHGIADLRKMTILDDTIIMGFQLFGKGFAGHLSLKGLAQRHCGAENWDEMVGDFLSRFRLTSDRNYGNLPTGMLSVYACLDAYWNRELYTYLKRIISPEMLNVTKLVTDMIKPFSEGEVKGVPIDQKTKGFLEEKYGELQESTKEDIYKLPKVNVYRQFDYEKMYKAKAATLKKSKPNPEKIWKEVLKLGNDTKIRDIMYGENYYNLPVLPEFMTNGGKSNRPQPQTGIDARAHLLENYLNDGTLEVLENHPDMSVEEVETLREARDFLDLLGQYSRMSKLLSNYLGEKLDAQCEDIMLKPDFNLIGTLGGRLSSGFHTIDSWSDIKRLYVSRWKGKGGIICAPDFSQLELRIAACVSNDPALIQAYVDDIDIHKMTASKVFGTPVEEVTKEQRAIGKCVDVNTWVKINNQFVRIGSLLPRDKKEDHFYTAKGVASTHLGNSNIKSIYSNGLKKRKLVITTKGVIACTGNHRFVLEDGTLKRADELEKDDILENMEVCKMASDNEYIELPINSWGDLPQETFFTKITEDLSYLQGAFLGDGVVNKKSIGICTGSEEKGYGDWANSVQESLRKLGFNSSINKSKTSQTIRFGSTKIAEIFRKMDLLKETGYKKKFNIPAYILNSPTTVRWSFLAGLIDTDGCVSKTGSFTFTSAHWELIQDVCTLSASLGIEVSLDPHFNKKYQKNYYRLRFRKHQIEPIKDFLRNKSKIERITTTKIIQKNTRKNKVWEVQELEEGYTCDLSLENEPHLYYTNGFLTHNTVNFGILYGKTTHGLAVELNVSNSVAEDYINQFFNGFPKLKTHFDKADKSIRTQGCIYTIWGRRILIDNWDSKNKGKLNAALRSGKNATIQSPASDCVLWTIRETYQELIEKELKTFMFASVHDSMEFDTAPGELFNLLNIVKTKAEVDLPASQDWINCPIGLGVEMGTSWGGGIEFDIEELTNSSFIGVGEGLRRDVQELIEELEIAYDVQYELIEKEETKPFDIAYVFTDTETWKIKLTITEKAKSLRAA